MISKKLWKPSTIPTIECFQGTLQEMLLNSLDILTFVVPPILPTALIANNAFAQKDWKRKMYTIYIPST